MVSAYAAVRRSLCHVRDMKLHAQSVKVQNSSNEQVADTQQIFDGFQRLDAPQYPSNCTQHTSLRAGKGFLPGGNIAKQTAETGTLSGEIGHDLTFKPDNTGVDIGLF